MELLSKKGGARLRHVTTYRLACDNKDVKGLRSIKTGDETMYDDFGHVMLSKLGNNKEPVVVKVFSSDSDNFLRTELDVMKRLRGTHFQRNLARYICDFSCLDDAKRWHNSIERGRQVCIDNGPNQLHFIVMEYIPDGDLTQFIRSATSKQLKSFITQTVLAFADLMTNCLIMHDDIHTGNILVRKTTRKTLTYHINGKLYRIKTEGFMPVLLDFGRAKLPDLGQRKIQNGYVIDELMLAVSAIRCDVKDPKLKASLKQFMSSVDRYHENFETMITKLRKMM
jgi:serine/threonine protein kinase